MTRVLIGSYTFNFIIALLTGMVRGSNGNPTPNFASIYTFDTTLYHISSYSPLNATGFFAVFYDIYNAVIGIADFFIFLFDMLVFIVSSIISVFSYLINQFTYIYTVLPPFLSGLIVLNLIVVLIITFVFGLEIFSTRLGGSD